MFQHASTVLKISFPPFVWTLQQSKFLTGELLFFARIDNLWPWRPPLHRILKA
jgi:hypothetical protein